MMKAAKKTPKREYRSPKREALRDATRGAIVRAAARLLRTKGAEKFSLDAVAKAAKVTRLTVYNQFGDRAGLFEAVFDEEARSGGLHDIREAMLLADPDAALDRIVEIFCAFWAQSGPMQGVVAAAMADAELGKAIRARNERRRQLLETLVERRKVKGKATLGSPRRERDRIVDTLFALTSFGFHAELGRSRLSADEVRATILELVRTVVSSTERARVPRG
jgi:AcrR family transcriptional regulator